MRYGMALLLIVALSAGYAYKRDLVSQYRKYQASQEEVNALEAEQNRLVEECSELDKRVENLGSDPVEIEAAIRRSKSLVRQDERVFRIELPEEVDGKASAPAPLP